MPVDPKDFRRVLGSFASGVTVVAAEVEGAIHGMTASAFISVSMDPPLVLVSVSRKAHLHPLVARAGAFTVSFLGAHQAAVSNHFAGRPDPTLDLSWRRTEPGAPVLADALATLDCTLEQAIDAGDHTLYVGRVRALDAVDGDPLTYFRGRYGTHTPHA